MRFTSLTGILRLSKGSTCAGHAASSFWRGPPIPGKPHLHISRAWYY